MGSSINRELMSILKLAKNCDEKSFELYTLYYSEASKFEHSDISTLDIYKKQVDNIDKNIAFIMDLNSTDNTLKDKIFSMINICYLDSFIKILDVIEKRESHLKVNYDIDKLCLISSKILIHLTK